MIQFAIVGFAVFWLVKILTRFKAKEQAKPAEPPVPTPTEALLTEIRDELRTGRPPAALNPPTP